MQKSSVKKTTENHSVSNSTGRLILADGSEYCGFSFGSRLAAAGEVVFNTGMVGYPESLTDPSYFGQILALTYPLIGNYGIPSDSHINKLKQHFESNRIQVTGLIVQDYSFDHSHWNSVKSLAQWLYEFKVPALGGIDIRALTKKLREQGTMLGKIEFNSDQIDFYDPDNKNLVEKVSITQPILYGTGNQRIALLDCGCKHNIIWSLLKRGVQVLRVPWDYDLRQETYDGLVISNGPGNPKMCRQVIIQIRQTIGRNIPILGICLGHQLLALAAGANTYKLKYGHRSQNQPVREVDSNRCLITSQNHGFAVNNATLPDDWLPWFINLNDQTSEGIRHVSGRFRSVQFHPEATPGPVDAGYLFDDFLKLVRQ